MGGCRHSRPMDSSRTDRQHAELRKKVSNTLQKSRERYLSAVLTNSETNLTELDSEQPKDCVKGVDGSADNGVKPGAGYTPGHQTPDREEGSKSGSEESDSSSSSSSGEDGEGETMSSVQVSLLGCEEEKKKKRRPVRIIRSAVKTGLIRGRPSFQPIGRYDRSASFHDEVDRKAARTDPARFTYPFENLVFEGGGNKGLAYCGAVRFLEELGVMRQVKRFAGASAGAMVAGLLAVGFSAGEIEQFLSARIDRVFLDASCGYLSLLPNILRTFGWNPGRRIYNWFGDKMKEKTGDPDFTFHQLYQKGTTLCIIVTNLSQMTTEYCHPKTTPDMPIRLALRMSMAIPGLFSAMKYKRLGDEDIYVDGGVLCNYPVHSFDGWYLSMDPKDSFLRRLQPLRDIPIIMERNNRFGSFNEKTLGMLLYSDAEEDILRINLERRVGCLEPAKPERETKLYVQRMKEARQKNRAEREYAQVVQAVDSFLRVLKKHNIDDNDVISRQELEAAFKDEEEFPRQQAEVLFGKDFTVSEAFQLLDRDNNGQIRYEELLRFIEENGVSLQSRFLGYQRREIRNFVSFLNTLTSTLTFNVQKLYVEERDLERTVGINTGHVHTTDFVLEDPDRDFVVQRGYNSMKSFLKYYAVCKPDKVTPRAQDKSIFPDIPEDATTTTTTTTTTTKEGASRLSAEAPAPARESNASGKAPTSQPSVVFKPEDVEFAPRGGGGGGQDEVDAGQGGVSLKGQRSGEVKVADVAVASPR
ncbi:uncharacterized protein LOC143294076 [Babylonia areolata]|uniref:uncharacterized protein LOC143294076 n=1 Tax=Babylonia areolata TaxID=304850 RepID=UPI003FD2E772